MCGIMGVDRLPDSWSWILTDLESEVIGWVYFWRGEMKGLDYKRGCIVIIHSVLRMLPLFWWY